MREQLEAEWEKIKELNDIGPDVIEYGKMKIYNGINQDNLKKYGKNNPHQVIGSTKVLYDGRYCGVSGFIYAVVNGKYSVLANKRGIGTPDFQGCWNCPCGFLEKFETSVEGIAREIYEECGIRIDMDKLKVVDVETDPRECNNGNVTIRHKAFLGEQFQFNTFKVGEGGEENEVEDAKWIPIEEIDKYPWAFNHYKLIKKYAPPRWKQKILEFLYKNSFTITPKSYT